MFPGYKEPKFRGSAGVALSCRDAEWVAILLRVALLTLIRHGQASFLADDYDRLSETGARQAHKLGEYWARAGVLFDQVYFGPARRHVQTGEIVLQRCRKAGLPWPDPLPLPEAQEYPGIEVMRAFLPGLMERHEEIREMEARFRTAGDRTAAGRLYDVLFQRITTMWVARESIRTESNTRTGVKRTGARRTSSSLMAWFSEDTKSGLTAYTTGIHF